MGQIEHRDSFSTTISMQRRIQSPFLSDEGCSFDMWHDYMDLARLMKRLCSWPQEEEEKEEVEEEGDTEEATEREKDQGGFGDWKGLQIAPQQQQVKSGLSSPGTSSPSTLSASSSSTAGFSTDYCRFCKQNCESPGVYRSHKLKSDDGKVTCPVLRNYTCPICEATGDEAHTRRYCPQLQRLEAARMARMPTKFW